jgi:nucleoside-diphosphate-sugar epimerase
MKVFVTDAGSGFAQALLPALCSQAAVEAVTGVDTRPLPYTHPKLKAVRLDTPDAAVMPMLEGHDALVHLAGPEATRAAGAARTLEARVRPAHRLFQAANAAGVQRLIHLSTASVYGTAIHASEQSPLRPLPDFPYAAEQAHLEQLLEIDFPHCVRLRPHLIVGPHAHPAVRRLLCQPFYPRLPEPQPLFQCVHEDDLAAAVVLSLGPAASGPYNIATEESFSIRDAIQSRRRMRIGLSASAARSALNFAARFLRYDIDPAWLDRASHTLLINCRRAIIELGWRRRYTAREALAATAA